MTRGGEKKVIKRYEFGDLVNRERFLRQLRTVSAIDYPNVCMVEEFFFDFTGSAMAAVVQFPFCEQGTLTQYLAKHRAPCLPHSEVVNRASAEAKGIHIPILKTVLRTLIHLHSHGIIHSDLKLDNLLVDGEGKVYLSDFDLVHDASSATPSMKAELRTQLRTHRGQVGGTSGYMVRERILLH